MVGPVLAAELVGETMSPADIFKTHQFFLEKGNRVKLQFPIEQSHFAWQNLSRFYPTAQIVRDGEIYQFPYALDDKIGQIKATVHGEEKTLNDHLDSYPVDAFLVVKDGKIVFERYITMRRTDKHNWFSNSKITSGILLAELVQEGKVQPEEPVSNYIPELKGSVWDTVSVLDTADMATGLDTTEHDEPNHDSRTNPDNLWFKWAISIGVFEGVITEGPFQVLAKMKRRHAGGERFEYNSINTFVVSRIVENVTGKPMNELISQRMWQPMGANNDAYVVVSPHGYTLQFFSMNTTLEDMARFGMLLTPSAEKLPGGKVIPDEVVQLIQNSGNPAMFGGGFAGQKFIKSFYNDKVIKNGYQFDAIFQDGDLFKSGVGGQGLYISPGKDLVIAFFSTGDGNNQEETYAREIAKYFSK